MVGSQDWLSAPLVPEAGTVTSVVTPVLRLRTKTSSIVPLGSLATRLLAFECQATTLPSALMLGEADWLLAPLVPETGTLTSVVTPVLRLRTKTSIMPL